MAGSDRRVGTTRSVRRPPICRLPQRSSAFEPRAAPPAPPRATCTRSIVRGEVPLGRVLRDARLAYRRQTRALLAIEPNAEVMGVFWMREARTLYGRQTEVIHHGAKIGDIVEVLPLV